MEGQSSDPFSQLSSIPLIILTTSMLGYLHLLWVFFVHFVQFDRNILNSRFRIHQLPEASATISPLISEFCKLASIVSAHQHIYLLTRSGRRSQGRGRPLPLLKFRNKCTKVQFMFRDDRKSHLRTSTTSEAACFSYVSLVSDTNVSLIF